MSTRYSRTSSAAIYDHLNELDDDIAAMSASVGLLQSSMTKTTTGHNAAGGAFAADVYTQVTGFTDGDTGAPVTLDAAAGKVTVVTAGRYDVDFVARWAPFLADHSRLCMIVIGTAATGTQIAAEAVGGAGWCVQKAQARGVYLDAGAVLTFWIFSDAAATFNNLSNPSTLTIKSSVTIRVAR